MDDWDEDKLQDVVNKKHGESNKAKPKTAIVSYILGNNFLVLTSLKICNHHVDLQILLGSGRKFKIWLVLAMS